MLSLISVASLIGVLLFSLWLSQSVLRSLAGLSSGLHRFGQGDFTRPIPVERRDELGNVAHEANQMAERIKGLLKELESFSYSVAHDLRAPLRAIMGFSTIVVQDCGETLPPKAIDSLNRVIAASKRMGDLIDSLLSLSRLARTEMKKQKLDLSELAKMILSDLQNASPTREATIEVRPGIRANGDPTLLQVVLTNLLGNAWKFTAKTPGPRIELGVRPREEDGRPVYFVKDNGAGFEMEHAGKLFGTFQRLHTNDEFEGTGIGLATVRTIIQRHGGEIWAEGKVGQGATFYFTL